MNDMTENQIIPDPNNYKKLWAHFLELGLFNCCVNNNEQDNHDLFDLIVQLAHDLDDPCALLAALFQLSGIMLPLAVHNQQSAIENDLLSSMLKGEKIAAHCLTEQNAGTDSNAMQTLATQVSGEWIIKGQKTYICNANIADIGLVYAKTRSNSTSLFTDLAAFFIDLKQPCIEVSPPLNKLGLHHIDMGSLSFNDAKCHFKSSIAGFTLLQTSTTYERLIIPLSFIGRMTKMYELCSVACRTNTSAHCYLSEMFINIQVAVSYARSVLSQINFMFWSRNYLQQGCCLKIHLTNAYLDAVKLAKKLYPYLSHDDKQFIQNEHKSALGAWIYSGTNDSLHSMLAKLVL